mmetsp:Transcript_21784/g.82857  ORF Transcript_21784/g.82857 Transcript_21784/m.82857 type:complete len:218 (+) Transcript_21784:2801-3454(+)
MRRRSSVESSRPQGAASSRSRHASMPVTLSRAMARRRYSAKVWQRLIASCRSAARAALSPHPGNAGTPMDASSGKLMLRFMMASSGRAASVVRIAHEAIWNTEIAVSCVSHRSAPTMFFRPAIASHADRRTNAVSADDPAPTSRSLGRWASPMLYSNIHDATRAALTARLPMRRESTITARLSRGAGAWSTPSETCLEAAAAHAAVAAGEAIPAVRN